MTRVACIMTPHHIHARLAYARHSIADGHSPDVALLDLSRTIKGHRTMTQQQLFATDDNQTQTHIVTPSEPLLLGIPESWYQPITVRLLKGIKSAETNPAKIP